MKTIGLIGGMSWESTVNYYSIINKEINRRLGRYHSAKLLLNSVDFDEIERSMSKERWDETSKILCSAASRLMSAGANCIILCTNTMHMNADDIRRSVSIPFIHIADATADSISRKMKKNALLLGTKFTMEENFLKKKFIDRGIKITVPEKHDRRFIHDVIFNELVKGVISEESRDMMLQILDTYADQGSDCAILGCTELGMILKQKEAPLTLFDTTYCHAMAAVDFALSR